MENRYLFCPQYLFRYFIQANILTEMYLFGRNMSKQKLHENRLQSRHNIAAADAAFWLVIRSFSGAPPKGVLL